MTATATFDIALVLRNSLEHFADAENALHELRRDFDATQLRAIDLLFEPPGLLIALLHFEAAALTPAHNQQLKHLARDGHFQLLRLANLAPDEQAQFYQRHLHRFSLRALDVRDLPAVLVSIYKAMCAAAAMPAVRELAVLAQSYATSEQFLREYSACLFGPGLLLHSAEPLHAGEVVQLVVTVGQSQGPIELQARVVHATDVRADAQLTPSSHGLGLKLLLAADEADLWEAFISAVVRNEAWPQRSGRCYERFPVCLRVEYHDGKELRREQAQNISRGGLHLGAFDPPAVGQVLDMSISAPGSEEHFHVMGKVVWSRSAAETEARGGPAGAGIEFLDSPREVRQLLQGLIARPTSASHRRALIVDDDRFFRTVVGNTLRLGGFEVLEAASGDEGFALLLDELLQLDAVIIDLYMPGMSGADLVQRINSLDEDVTFALVIITGAELDEDKRKALFVHGVDAVISKRNTPEQFLEELEGVLPSPRG